MNRRSFLKLIGLGSLSLPFMGMVKKGLAQGGIVKKPYVMIKPEMDVVIPIRPGWNRVWENRCQWIFKDERCGYQGMIKKCDYTFMNCCNKDNFGGYCINYSYNSLRDILKKDKIL